jgi:hypothetical protein
VTLEVIRFGRVVVRGVFAPGSSVSLVEVARGAMHSAGGHRLALGTADEGGVVDFPDCQFGSYYFVVGRVDGQQVEIPVRPQPDHVWDGAPRAPWPDPPRRPAPVAPFAAPALRGDELMIHPAAGRGGPVRPLPQRQEDVPPDVRQASATPLGVATPIDPADVARIQRHRETRL